jgi:hypothetical protein
MAENEFINTDPNARRSRKAQRAEKVREYGLLERYDGARPADPLPKKVVPKHIAKKDEYLPRATVYLNGKMNDMIETLRKRWKCSRGKVVFRLMRQASVEFSKLRKRDKYLEFPFKVKVWEEE